MEKLNPINYINLLQKQKYKATVWPIILVIITFIINHIHRVDEVKYIALFGLIWYMFIFVIFKINKPFPPEKTIGSVFSPLNGKIIRIENNRIFITKYFWQPVDIRNASSEKNIEINFSGKQPVLWENFSAEIGKLIGYKTGKINCEILLSEEYSIKISEGQKVISGQTILASKEI